MLKRLSVVPWCEGGRAPVLPVYSILYKFMIIGSQNVFPGHSMQQILHKLISLPLLLIDAVSTSQY